MIKITDSALAKIVSVLDEEGSTLLRFGLQGGGCSGFQYFFQVTDVKDDTDTEISIGAGYTLLVDTMSMMYLENAEIDFKKDLMGENFVFNNPQMKSSCGCGKSVGI